MNLPNKLTLARCVMTPIFLALMVMDFPHHYAAALLVFILASLTDWLDGKIARKNNLVTNLGKFLDPLAYKALTTAAYIGLVQVISNRSMAWMLFLVLLREFAVTSVRLMAAKDGVVVAASFAGKLKTVMQMVSIIFALAYLEIKRFSFFADIPGVKPVCSWIALILLWIGVVATVVSGIQYVWQLRHYFKETTD